MGLGAGSKVRRLLLLTTLALFCLAASQGGDLVAGTTLVRALEPGEAEDFELTLAAGDYVEVAVEQQGIDVVVTLFDPAGKTLLEVDSPTGAQGPETVLAVAATGGRHRLEVRASEPQTAGRFELRVVALAPAGERQRTRAAAARSFVLGEHARRARSHDEAVAAYGEALRLFESIGDAAWEAETCDRLGRVLFAAGRRDEAAVHLRRAVAYFAAADEPAKEAINQDYLGRILRSQGDAEGALERYGRALELWRRAGRREEEAITLNNLGGLYRQIGEVEKALDLYGQALIRWREAGNRRSEATTLHNLGVLHVHLGRPERALDEFQAAERLWREIDAPDGLSATLRQKAQVYVKRGDDETALGLLEEALALERRAGDRRGEAVTLAAVAEAHSRRGDASRALALCQEALATFVELGDRRGEADMQNNRSTLLSLRGEPRQALAAAQRALELYRTLQDGDGEAVALVGTAFAERQLGELKAARRHLEEAFALFEELRRKALSPEMRATYFSTLQAHFAFYVELLLDLDRHEPGAGYAEAALEASERSRARSLLEQLETDADVGADPELVRRKRHLQEQLNVTDRLCRSRLAAGVEKSEVAALEARLRKLAEELNTVRARLSRPTTAVLGGATPLSVDEIRRQVLDAETLLLEVTLGERHSFLFLLGNDRLHAYELPPQRELERLAGEAYHFLARSHRRESAAGLSRTLCALGKAVLGPLAGELGEKRLAVVADGALGSVPFTALPDPRAADCATAPPLVARHEIVQLPSASSLAVLRRELAGRPRAQGAVAVVADPAYGGSFRRLPFSRREAEAILAAADGSKTYQALGFDATKANLLSGALTGYRIVHFATHATLDVEHPELSSIVLSQVDEGGRPLDGRLRMHEIPDLGLNADLVVLSACRTALGHEIRGEGLIGLTRAFMNAGTPRLVVSLWNVDDASTAELVQRFYDALLRRGLSPAAALREAQLGLRREPGREAPFYWAGFVLQGDWR